MATPDSDIIVLGAGIVGLATARALARRRMRVTVVTRDEPGCGASLAGAGMLEVHFPAPIPPALAVLCERSRALYDMFAAELLAETGYDIGIDTAGTIALATDEAERADLASQAKAIKGSKPMDREEAWLAMEPGLGRGLKGALFLPDDHSIDPVRVCRALLMAAERAGARVMRGVTATGWLVEGGRVAGLATDAGPLKARLTVNAGGAWAGQLPGLPFTVPVHPVKGQLVHLIPSRMPGHVLQVRTLYMVPRPGEGRVILGATVEEAGYDVRPTAGGVRQLLEGGIRLFPDLAGAEITEIRVGLRPGTPDGIPILGRTPLDGLLLASGPFRKGILLAPVVSDIVSRLAAGEDPGVPLEPYSVTRFAR
jgi:glycine oxidase